MTRKFIDNLNDSGEEVALEPNTYDLEVIDARDVESSPKMIFMDLKVLNGPDANRVTTVGLYIPEDEERGAQFHFKKKTRGLISALKQVASKNLDDDEFIPALAEAFIGCQFEGKLGVQSGGDYDGRQELQESRPLGVVLGDTQPPLETDTHNETSPTSAPEEVPF